MLRSAINVLHRHTLLQRERDYIIGGLDIVPCNLIR